MATLVKFYGQFDVQMYYELWNEPDLFYWQDGVDKYLELYAETAKAIKAADPRAKVGGAAVNQWDGKAKRNPRHGALGKLRETIRAGKPREPGHADAFCSARLEVVSAMRIKDNLRAARVRVQGNRLACDLDKNEVLVLELNVDWERD